ncbi:MAG: FAD:protein FMN transferase [Proteobacteria bacterium]|nr:FAD:protein FMN transferase [Pseudomonadota bacterium]
MMNRRSFLKLFAIGGTAAAAGVAIAHKDTFESLLHDGQYRVSQSQNAIGTHVDITAFGPSQMHTEDAVHAAFNDIREMEKLLTRFGNASPVCELNEEGHLDHIPAEILSLCQTCDFYYRDTNGAFDITVKPIIDLFARSAAAGRQPSESEIAQILPHVGASQLSLHDNRLTMPKGTGITFDGAAPGFIADRAAQILHAHGIDNFLVNAGGEIRTSGHPQGADAWRIAIQDPAKKGNFPGYLAMNNAAVSTSGNYEIFFGNDKTYHHIIDARTGHSPRRASVTVTAPTALEADILSTALFVMSPQEALQYTASHPQFACLIIDEDGKQTVSPNFKMA